MRGGEGVDRSRDAIPVVGVGGSIGRHFDTACAFRGVDGHEPVESQVRWWPGRGPHPPPAALLVPPCYIPAWIPDTDANRTKPH